MAFLYTYYLKITSNKYPVLVSGSSKARCTACISKKNDGNMELRGINFAYIYICNVKKFEDEQRPTLNKLKSKNMMNRFGLRTSSLAV